MEKIIEVPITIYQEVPVYKEKIIEEEVIVEVEVPMTAEKEKEILRINIIEKSKKRRTL